jgi:hypothetical protein
VHGSADIFLIFLRILLTALRLFPCPVSPIGSICASPSRPSSSFYDLLLLMLLSHSQVHFCTLEWTTSLIVVYKEALDHLGRSDLSDTVFVSPHVHHVTASFATQHPTQQSGLRKSYNLSCYSQSTMVVIVYVHSYSEVQNRSHVCYFWKDCCISCFHGHVILNPGMSKVTCFLAF